MKNNPLYDTNFLYELDHYRNRIVYVRMLSLTTENYPIEQIEGVATGGSITVDGSSAVRRVISLTMTTKNLNINNIYWGLNARVKIEVGLENKFNANYPDIIWFPQGVFLITEFKTNSQVNNYTITLTGKDKMCLLNGDMGGVFNAETDIGTEQYWDEDLKKYVIEKKTLQYVIKEMIHHYAKESLGNIVVRLNPGYDILSNRTGLTLYVVEDQNGEPSEVKTSQDDLASYYDEDGQVVKKRYYIAGSHALIDFSNMPKNFIYHYMSDEDRNSLIAGEMLTVSTPVVDDDNNRYTIRKIENKEDIGYQIHELDFPDDLIAAPGDTVTSILDKIIERFPMYHYFYNINGQFVFQPRNTYVNTSWNSGAYYEDQYFILPMALSRKVVYSFEGNQIVQALQNNPKFNEIKNDFTVWGTRTLPSGVEQKIHMRYAIDEKPKYYVTFPRGEDGRKDLYITKEYYEEAKNKLIGKVRTNWLDKKTKPPAYLLNATYYSYESYINDKNADLIPVSYTEDELNEKWWDILEWAEYYKEIFGEYPTQALKDYGVTGAIAAFTFPDGSQVIVEPDGAKRKMSYSQYPLIRIKYAAVDSSTSLSNAMLIFDTYAETGNPFIGPIRTDPTGHKNYSWNPFQHGFHNCGHTYKQFMDRANGLSDAHMGGFATEPGEVQSWIYNPQIPKEKETEAIKHIEELNDAYNLHIVDWREIIYQMALDYYAHGHEDEFHISIFHNNDLYKYEIPRIYTYYGMTKYEQYYHDIEGFWRTLYIPRYQREAYLSNFRKLTGIRHEVPDSITWAEDNESYEYNENLTTSSIYTNSLSEDKVYFYFDQSGTVRYYDVEGNPPLTDASGLIYTRDILVKRDLAIKEKKDEYDSLNLEINDKLAENSTLYTQIRTGDLTVTIPSKQVYDTETEELITDDENYYAINLNKKELLKYYTEEEVNGLIVDVYTNDGSEVQLKIRKTINNDFHTFIGGSHYRINGIDYGILKDMMYVYFPEEDKDTQLIFTTVIPIQKLSEVVSNNTARINELSNRLVPLQTELQQVQQALCPYSLFYTCETNEEDFYGNIEYTPNGYPIYTEYTAEEESLVGEYNKNIVYNPQELIFWFDFFDANSLGLGQFSVPAIGDRPEVEQNESIKALIYQDVPDFIFVKKENYEKDPNNLAYYDYKTIILDEGDFFRDAIDNGDIRVSTRHTTALESIDNMLYEKAYCNEEIQLTTVPIYYLEPNIIVSARDENQLVNGYYILSKMTIPLTYNGTMKSTLIRVPERIY